MITDENDPAGRAATAELSRDPGIRIAWETRQEIIDRLEPEWWADVAFIMALVERGVYYDFTISFSEKFAGLSPGTYLMLLLLAELPRRGIHTVVSYGPHSYKKRWASAFVPMSKVYIIGRSLRARVGRFNHFVLAPRLGRAPVREWE